MSILKLPKKVSEAPGVYIWRLGKRPIYVGKAENLKKRLSSYFRKNAGAKVESLRDEATRLEWTELTSDVEALIREAVLIKKYQPKYNVIMRDDKNYFFVGCTKEEYPHIFVTHQPIRARNLDRKSSFIGPFTSGSALYQTLKILRRVFPYCTCKELHTRPCLNAEIGRCLGCCCQKNFGGDETCKTRYNNNIKNIAAVLSGKKKTLVGELTRRMRDAAKNEEYELALVLRNQIEGIENIFLHRKFLDLKLQKRGKIHDWTKIERTIQSAFNTSKKISRVEGYDISNISGTGATGSMVVFVDGVKAKDHYRKFKVQSVHQPSDVDMMKEVISRRLNHPEWGLPDLLVIDGGKPQLNAVLFVLRSKILNSRFKMPLIAGLAKREEELFLPYRTASIRLDSLPSHTMHFFKHVRDESHRFAKKYHHKLREISYREDT